MLPPFLKCKYESTFAALKGKTFLALFSPTDRLHFLRGASWIFPERNSTQGQEEASPSMLQSCQSMNNTHIFFTAFLTVFTCSHSLTTVNVYCEGEALRNTMISREWNHNELRPKSQIFTQTERQSSCSASVLSDLFSPFVVCCFKKKVFCAHRSQSKHHWRKNNLSWDLERRETETLDFTQAASLQHFSLFSSTSMIHSRKSSQAGSVEPVTLKPSCPSPPPTANNRLPSGAEDWVLGNLSA